MDSIERKKTKPYNINEKEYQQAIAERPYINPLPKDLKPGTV